MNKNIQTSNCVRVYADETQISRCRNSIKALDSPIANITNVLSLSGNQARFKILWLLNSEKSLCVCDLSDILEMSIPAVSQHLRKLKDAQIVATRKVGATVYYSLHSEGQNRVKQILHLITLLEKTQEI